MAMITISRMLRRVLHVVEGARVQADEGEGPEVHQQQVRQEGRPGHGRVAEEHHCCCCWSARKKSEEQQIRWESRGRQKDSHIGG